MIQGLNPATSKTTYEAPNLTIHVTSKGVANVNDNFAPHALAKANPQAQKGAFAKLMDYFTNLFKDLFCCFFSKKPAAASAAPASTVVGDSKADQYGALLLAASVRRRSERKEALKQAFESLPQETKQKLIEKYDEKFDKDLVKHLAANKGRAFDFLSNQAQVKWGASIDDVWEEFHELIEDTSIKKAHKEVASMLMKLDDTTRQLVLHEIFNIPMKTVRKTANNETKIAKELLKAKMRPDQAGHPVATEEGVEYERMPFFGSAEGKNGKKVFISREFGTMIAHKNESGEDSSDSSESSM